MLTPAAETRRKPEVIRIRHQHGTKYGKAGSIIFSLFVICSFTFAARGSQANTAGAKIEGRVFVRDAAGNRSFVAGATVRLTGPITLETETDENGNYVVAVVPLGTYTVEVVFPGIEARRTVRVEAS